MCDKEDGPRGKGRRGGSEVGVEEGRPLPSLPAGEKDTPEGIWRTGWEKGPREEGPGDGVAGGSDESETIRDRVLGSTPVDLP